MKSLFRLCALLLLVATPTWAADVPPSFADLVEKLTPAVVNISTTQKIKGGTGMQMFELPEGSEEQMPEEFRQFFEQFGKKNHGKNKDEGEGDVEHEVYSLGSGFIIDADGYIATNSHVVADAEEVTVTLSDDTKLKAKIIGRDAKTDLALLKVDAGRKLPFVQLGDSDAARVGDWVIAIGNPFGLGGTVTAGIISARARDIHAGPFDDFLQTDAAINRGNSGGPMFNTKGEVIGINTAIFSPSGGGGSVGIGFAIPMALAKPVLLQLKASGHIDRGWLGVKIQPVTDEIAESVGLPKPEGALVMEVTKGGPADKAGIQVGDIIIRFAGKEVKEMRNLPRLVADAKKGVAVPVEVWRGGKTLSLQATIGELKEEKSNSAAAGGEDEEGNAPAMSAPKTREMLGMSVANLNGELREKYSIAQDVKGVVITKLKGDSEAARHGITEGDVILQLGNVPVANTKDMAEALAQARKSGRKFVLARLIHGQEAVFVPLPVEEAKAK